MKVYQTYDSQDMANTDSWFPTLKEAVNHIKTTYDFFKPIKLDEDGEWSVDLEGIGTIYLVRHEIKATKHGICSALMFLPNR